MEQNPMEAVVAAAGMCTAYNADDWARPPVQSPASVEAPTNDVPPALD